jgi:predicted acetyltransferase
MMDVRQLSEDERDDAYALSSLAFLQGSRDIPWANDPNGPVSTAFGVWDEGGYQAQAIVLSFRVHMGAEAVMRLGGIAGVACKPAARGRGYATAALLRSLRHMRDVGEVVSTLYPFSWQFYQQLGWEWTGQVRRYKAPARIFEPTAGTARCREAKPEDRERIAEAYERVARGYRGLLQRDTKQWNRVLDDTTERWTYTYVYEGQTGIEGYLTYSGGSGDVTELREFVSINCEAQQALLGLVGRLDMQTRNFEWRAPEDDLLWSALCNYEIETRLWPMTQARVVDVEGALSQWVPDRAAAGRFTMRIADAQADWNDGTWGVEFSDGAVTVARASCEADLAMDIRTLSQAFFGSPTVATLRRAGKLAVADERGYEAFRDCLSGPPMWTNDFF